MMALTTGDAIPRIASFTVSHSNLARDFQE